VKRRMATPHLKYSREKEIFFHGVTSGLIVGAIMGAIITMAFVDLSGGI